LDEEEIWNEKNTIFFLFIYKYSPAKLKITITSFMIASATTKTLRAEA
jgi:hypothetical protein